LALGGRQPDVRTKRPKSVIVLGGGIAGLAAAHELRRTAPKIEILLLEARQLLGGRVLTARDPSTGEPLELGAEFVHGRPPALLQVLREARIPIDEGHGAGDAPDSPFELLPDLLAPFLGSGEPDRTIASVLGDHDLSPRRLAMLRGYIEGFYVAPFERASARAIARMEVAARRIEGGRAAQVPGGYDVLVQWLARALGPADLRLGTIAHAVDWRPGRVEVHARSLAGTALPLLRADRAILALPVSVLDRKRGSIVLRPDLPATRRAAAALRMGHATKVFLRFDESIATDPFFFSGGPVPVWWTAAAKHSRWLVGWAGGRAAEALDRLSDGAVMRAGLASVALYSGHGHTALGRALTGFRCARWSRQPFIGGAYAVVPVGADGAMAALATPAGGTLYFAGEATNPEHAGTVHGAYESGVRAARQVLSGE
jgi:monoamine oxidase